MSKTYSPLILLLLILFSLSSCKKNDDKIIGTWERFDDESSGSVIKVEKVGENLAGKLHHVSGNLVELGFEAGDLKWKEIAADTKEQKRYIGKDLIKAVDQNNQVSQTEYVDIYIEFLSNDIIQILDPSGVQGGMSKPQKWRRIDL